MPQHSSTAKISGIILEIVKTFAIVFTLSFFIRSFLVQPFMVDGSSMEPNFHNQEFIMTAKAAYRFHGPERGDVVVFHNPLDPRVFFIKRIIGLPGESVSISSGEVRIDGDLLPEPYLPSQTVTSGENQRANQVTLGDNEYFVMGDNRSNSYDSRYWGPLKGNLIVGKFWTVIPSSLSSLLAPLTAKTPSN